jgi:nitric oxide reductase activation protein
VYEAVKKEILNFDPKARKFFVNISDGAPAFSIHSDDRPFAYHGELAYKHTAQQMRDFRAAGITILSYYVENGGGSDHETKAFRQMYGRDAAFIDVDQVTQIARTINKMFMRDCE